MKLHILHNVRTDRMYFLEGYKDDDPLTLVYKLTIPEHVKERASQQDTTEGAVQVMCEYAYMTLNIGHEDFAQITDEGRAEAIAYRERKNRSLSMGDVICLDGAFFACARIGWEQVRVHPYQIVMDYADHGTTSLDRVRF